MKKLFRKIRFHVLKFFVRVRVYDNYTTPIYPILRFRNKVRYWLGLWIPIGEDTPFGRIGWIKGSYEDSGLENETFDRISDMGKNTLINGVPFNITHWKDIHK